VTGESKNLFKCFVLPCRNDVDVTRFSPKIWVICDDVSGSIRWQIWVKGKI